MGLFNSVISDARPAKPAYGPTSLSGQPLHAQNSSNKLNGSGPTASAESIHNPATSEGLSTYGQSAPVKPGLIHYPSEQREPQGHGETDLGANLRNESATKPSKNKPTNGLIQHLGEQPGQRTSEIDRPTAKPALQKKQPGPGELPVFTFTDRGVENTVRAEIQHSSDQPLALTRVEQVADNKKYTTHEKGRRASSDNPAAMTLGRDEDLDTAIHEATRSIESDNQADLISERDQETHDEKLPKPMESAIDRQFSDSEAGHTPPQAFPDGQCSVKHHLAMKLSDESFEALASALPDQQEQQGDPHGQPSSPDILWDNTAQQPSIDSVASNDQPTTARSSAPQVLPAKDAQLDKLSSAIQQQHQEQVSANEKLVRRVETRSTSLIEEQFSSHRASDDRSLRTPGVESPRTADVKIGQVDVFIEKSSKTLSRRDRATRPSISLSSRHYLRRL